MRTFLATLLVAGCGGDGDDADGPTDTTDTDDTDVPPVGDCVTGTFTIDGGTLEADGASVAFGSGSFVATTDVTLCRDASTDPLIPGPIWRLTPEMELAVPALLSVEHDGDEVDSHLFVPWWDMSPLRSLQETRPSAGVIRAPIYRLGANWVAADTRVTEDWAPSDNDRVDLLFVVDSSSSAGTNPSELSALAGAIVKALGPSGLDYHVGVVTTDLDSPAHRGRLRQYMGNRWVDPTTSDPAGVLGALLNVPTTGSETTQGIGAAYLAVGPELTKGDNAGFQRVDASLAVLFVADEDDATSSSLLDPATLPQALEALKEPWASAALHGLVPTSGTYADVIDASGGLRDSISAPQGDWLALVEDVLDGAGVGDGGLVLSQLPAPATLQVWWVPADEEPVKLQNQYLRYDPDDNEVLVEPGVFAADELVVLYQPAD